MRRTAAFITALLFTASFMSSTWTVSAEDSASVEITADSDEDTQENNAEEEPSDENTEENTGENPEENAEENPGENPEEKEPVPGDELLKFTSGISENDESAYELAVRLLKKETTAAGILRDWFSAREYAIDEEGGRAVIADICRTVLMDEEQFETEYARYEEKLAWGMSRIWFLREYVSSDDFAAFCETNEIDRGEVEITENRDRNPAVTKFLQRIYNNVLDRTSDISGLNNWCRRLLDEGRTGAYAVNGFYFSKEYKDRNTSDEEYVTSLIKMFMGREPEEGEVQKWVDSTLAQGHTRDAVLRKFILTDEFAKLCEEAGITAGDITVGGWKTNEPGFKCYYSPDTGMMLKGYNYVTGILCYFDNEGSLRTDWSDLADIVDTEASVYSFTEMEHDIAELQQQYPSLVTVRSLGVTFDGRQIYDIIIGDPDSGTAAVISSGVRGDEASESRRIMAETEKFLRSYSGGSTDGKNWAELLEQGCIHIIPMINPDGVSIVQYGLRGIKNESLKARIKSIYTLDRRDGYTDLSFDEYLKTWRANALGVDLQYNVLQTKGEGKAHPSCNGYAGEQGVYERETEALRNFAEKHEGDTINLLQASDFILKYGTDEYPLADFLKDTVSEQENTAEENPSENPSQEPSDPEQTEPENPQENVKTEKDYVSRIYRILLRREPDAVSLNSWADALNSGSLLPSDMITIFTESKEFENKNYSNDDFVSFVFEAACGRTPSDEEKSKYTGLLNDGYSRSYVTARITELSDFVSACSTCGIRATRPVSDGWHTDSNGTFYWQNGMKIRNDLRNLEGFTYIFDNSGRLLNGSCNIGSTGYYAINGYVMPRRGIDWAAEVKKGNVRGETGLARRMNVPVDYQFLYTRTICTIGGVEKTVREAGCGAASASMVIRYFTGETKYTPEYLFEWAYNNNQYFGNGLAESTITNFLSLAGLKSYWIDPSAERVSRALRTGKPVIALVREGYFTSAGHYIVLTGITDDGYVTVNDPNNSSLGKMEFRLETVLEQAKCFMICGVTEAEDNKPEEPETDPERENKAAFLERLYETVLGRSSDAQGLSNWIGRLESGSHTGDSALYGFVNSKEYRDKNTSDEEFIDMIYRAAMDREPDEEGKNYWLSCLKQGYLRAGVVKGFTETDEFAAICEKYNIARGTFNAGGWSKNSEGEVVYCASDTGRPLTGYNVVNNINCYFDEQGVLRTDWSDLTSYVDTSSAVYSYEDMVNDIKGLKEQYPSLVDIQSIGITADGRQIYDLVIGSSDAEKQMVIQAGCHAREYMGCMLLMNQTEYLLANYWDGKWTDKSYRELLENYQIHIIPMLNPDGITLSQRGLDGINSADLRAGIQEIYRRDLAEGVTSLGLDSYLRSWKANARGVDINRNFGVPEWADQGEIQRASCGKYAGPAADSEAETQAVEKLINSLRNCRSVISYHSSGSMIYWQYHQSGDFLEKSRSIANSLKNMTGYYLISEVSSGGGCSNWVADVKKIFACTIEIGSGDSPLPLNQYSGIWNSNKNVIPYMLSAY